MMKRGLVGRRRAASSEVVAISSSVVCSLGSSPSSDPGDEAGDLRRVLLGPGEQLVELGVVDDRLRLLALDHAVQLRAGEVGVHEQHGRAELRAGEQRVDEAAVVAAHDRDPIRRP